MSEDGGNMNSGDYSYGQGVLEGFGGVGEEEPRFSLNSDVRQLNLWLDEMQEKSAFIYAKRLSANDTGATDSHQVGIYLPEAVVHGAMPSIRRFDTQNPDLNVSCNIRSHGPAKNEVRAVYYNNKYFGGTRDEARLTCWAWGGYQSPMKDPENTGALAIFAFSWEKGGLDADVLDVWVCRSPGEEELIEEQFGAILPGAAISGMLEALRGGVVFQHEPCRDVRIPSEWTDVFPTGKDILELVFKMSDALSLSPDERLMKRRELEFSVFQMVERSHVLPKIKNGFLAVDDFIAVANSVANRRKSRSGKSLELHLGKIFDEEGLKSVGEQCVTENRKKPDFLFPCCAAYKNLGFPAQKLRMLGVKTTCKDRWRQVLSEAERIPEKHLFTLQEGVSENQYDEMRGASITLVVPKGLHRKYPKKVRDKIMTLSEFVADTKKYSY